MAAPIRFSNKKLREVGQVFFKLGCTAFGGPAAHIAILEEEIVRKRQWMTHEHFLDLIGATNLIPGPNSTEMAMHCGHERAGWEGLFLAGLGFIVPAFLITLVFAWFYALYGQVPNAEPFIYGIRPAVLAVIAAAILKLAPKAAKTRELMALGLAVLIASLLGVNEITALLGAGLFGTFYFRVTALARKNRLGVYLPLPLLFLKFLKVGAILYGSGYVLFAYLDAELVRAGWITRSLLMDAIAVGQFTPGPLLSSAAFIGYQIHGFTGALLATLGVFLPSFLFVLCLNPFIPKMRKSPLMADLLDCVNVAAVAVMTSVLVKMGQTVFQNWRACVIAALAFAAVFIFKKANSAWLVLGGACAGYLLSLL